MSWFLFIFNVHLFSFIFNVEKERQCINKMATHTHTHTHTHPRTHAYSQ